jgi:hypothetical protein
MESKINKETVSFSDFEASIKRIAIETRAIGYVLGVRKTSGDKSAVFWTRLTYRRGIKQVSGKTPNEVCEQLYEKPAICADVLIENVPVQLDEIPR